MGFKISVDTGGTFTDVVVTDENGNFTVGKALTNKQRAFLSVKSGLEVAADQLETDLGKLLSTTDIFIYGTTRATNGIVEHKTAKTAFLTTAGFPDILLLKEGGKTEPHNLTLKYPDPYIPRSLTFEIIERINAEGGVETALNKDEAIKTIETLKEEKIEAVAVCLLWSIANPIHELEIAELLRERLPNVPFTLSHQLNPIVREYRRASSAAIDASLKPMMQEYLLALQEDLKDAGYQNDVLVSTSFGGVMHLSDIVEKPIFLVKSGPAMAPVAGMAYVESENLAKDIIVCDAGGTTFDVSLVRNGTVEFSRDTWLGPQWIGDNLGMASVAVHSIGAGGGSIAWIDSGGLLRVGPSSAGSEPGPACYNLGGTEPTVTDAAVVLGYIDPEHFLGGRMQLNKDKAIEAVSKISEVFKESVEKSAYAIVTVANENMIEAIKELTINEGIDPSESTLVAGGGAGGLGIIPIAGELGCRTILVPRTAGALSASGMQFSDIITETGASQLTSSDNFNYEGVKKALGSINKELDKFESKLSARGVLEMERRYFVEARYRFQVWELEIELRDSDFKDIDDVNDLVERFHQMHERVFAITDEGQVVECLNWRGRLIGKVETPNLQPSTQASEEMEARKKKTAFFDGQPLETAVRNGDDLKSGNIIHGPAIIEEQTSTLVVYPDSSVEVSGGGHYIIKSEK